MPSDNFWTVKFASLRYAVGWLGYAWMRAIVQLPFSWQLALGKRLGRLARLALASRRRIAERNLQVCFPELTDAQRAQLVRRHFEALGASLIETAMGWFGREPEVLDRVRVEGEEHLRAALAHGRGVILHAAHFTTLELFWPALRPLCPHLSGMYKSQRNPIMNKAMHAGRGRNFDAMIAKDNVRAMLKNLARNSVFWYAADQSFGGKSSALLPFFGEPAMTNTAISRIARASGAVVLPYFCRRLPDDSYAMILGAPLANFPSDDEQRDTAALTQLLEEFIRTCPEQYWWTHQRFKGRPAPYPNLYGHGSAADSRSAAPQP